MSAVAALLRDARPALVSNHCCASLKSYKHYIADVFVRKDSESVVQTAQDGAATYMQYVSHLGTEIGELSCLVKCKL